MSILKSCNLAPTTRIDRIYGINRIYMSILTILSILLT
jgi:hypothetical protein